ncbi:MAG: RdgB/HAM1 family non-canonical purine NTP pyrophosphatase [Actinobacteria bacterium]|nr:RdgB/HAM1 family non-canonical purine NTP pyrophosphatase [Actinomycetota bacterium]
MTYRVVLATANPDKARELRAVLATAGLDLELVPRPGEVAEVEETGATLLDNARLKAKALGAATGMPTLADDTGLEVDALDGAPGVRSARYAGDNATYEDNVVRLLRDLAVRPDRPRTARFVTVVVLSSPDGSEVIAQGQVEGVIADAPRGGNGFGYDPVFVPEGGGRTFAEMAPGEKDAISHRGRALRDLAARLRESGWPTNEER